MAEGATKQKATETQKTEPPEPFGSSYEKAHRAYGLTAALLLSWELIGIDLGDKPLPSIDVRLKSPQAVPWVLVVLLLYFAFKYTIEWFQATPERRGMRAAQIDFAASHSIGALSLVVLMIQLVFQIQIANQTSLPGVKTIVSGLCGGFGLWNLCRGVLRLVRRRKTITTKIAKRGFISMLDEVGLNATRAVYRRQLILGPALLLVPVWTINIKAAGWLFWISFIGGIVFGWIFFTFLKKAIWRAFIWKAEASLNETIKKHRESTAG